MKILPGFGREQLPGALVNAGLLLGAEIGVDRAEHAELLLWAGVDFLFLVDRWAEEPADAGHDAVHSQNYAATIARLARFPGQYSIKRAASVAGAQEFNDGYFDFIYLDADHRAAAVSADLEAWYPKVRSGGWICGHDWPEVRLPVWRFLEKVGVTELCVANEPNANWHFVKP